MAKSKRTTPTFRKLSRNRLLMLAGFSLLILAIIGQLVFDLRMARRQDESTPKVATLILSAIQNANKPAIIEPLSKQTYLPDANLVLPATPKLGDVRYQYLPAVDGVDATMNVTLATVQSASSAKILANTTAPHQERVDFDAIFSALPEAQKCARGIAVSFGAKNNDLGTLQFTKQLADGRTMQVYQEQPVCPYDLQPLLTALRQAESY